MEQMQSNSEFVLDKDNYYSREADRHYLSASQYEAFLECEAAAMAKLQGRYTPEESEALLVGRYFHSWFEGEAEFKQFCAENSSKIFKIKETKARGIEIVGKYAPFEVADRMIAKANADPMIKQLIDLPGENEIMMHGKLFGMYPWKIRLDKYIPDKRLIIDWKTVANIQEVTWSAKEGAKVTFIENFNYMMRAAVYIEIEKQFTGKQTDPVFMLVCLSKQDPPDKEMILLNHRQRLDLELEKIQERIGRIQRIKDGLIVPTRCGHCEYCRSTKKIFSPIEYFKLEPANRGPREEDYAYSTDSVAEPEQAEEIQATIPDTAVWAEFLPKR